MPSRRSPPTSSSAATSAGTMILTPPTEPVAGIDDVPDLSSASPSLKPDSDSLDDFSDEAVLQSYSRRQARPWETDTKPGSTGKGFSPDLKGEDQVGVSNDGASGTLPHHAVSTQITRAESGLYNGQKAHLITLKVEHSSDSPLQHLALDLTIQGVPAISETGTSPFIIDYVVVSDRRWYSFMATEQSSRRFYKDEKFKLNVRLSKTGEMGDGWNNRLSIQAVANPFYNEDLPNLGIGLVIVSFGSPFTLSAQAEFAPPGGDLRRVQLISTRHPAKFSHDGVDLIPAGEEKIGIDFADDELEEVWARILPSPLFNKGAPQPPKAASSSRRVDSKEGAGPAPGRPDATPRGDRMNPTGPHEFASVPGGEVNSDHDHGPDLSHLDWSEEAIQKSLEPREILAKPVMMSPEDQAAWDREFGDSEWNLENALFDVAPGDSGFNKAGSGGATPTSQPAKASKADQRTKLALKDFEYSGKVSDLSTEVDDPHTILDKKMWNGLQIVCLIPRIQSGTYRGKPATFVGLVVRFINSDVSHSVRRSVISARVWNVPQSAAMSSLASASTPALTNLPRAAGPAHLSPISSSTGSVGGTSVGGTAPSTPVRSSTDMMPPGAYPVSPTASVTTLPSTPTSSTAALAGAPLTASASAPAASPSHGVHVPYFVDHRPQRIVGPALEDLLTIQHNLGGQIGTPNNPALSALFNAARQVTHQYAIQHRSQVEVEIVPHRHRHFGSQLPVPNVLKARSRTNPLHQNGFKEIKIGTVIVSNGCPFVMTVEVECVCKNSLHFHEWPYTDEWPAQIGPGQVKVPPDEARIGTEDFSSEQMRQVEWDRLVPLLAGYERVSRSSGQGFADDRWSWE